MRTIFFLLGMAVSGASLLAQPELPAAQKVDRNVIYGMYSGLALLMDVYYPQNSNGLGVIHIAGSGFSRPLSWDAPMINHGGHVKLEGAALVKAGYTLFSVNHRALPRFKYPAAVEDVQRAVRYIRYHAEKFGINPDKIGAVGGSSGGHLVSMLGLLDGEGDPHAVSPIDRLSAKVQCVVARATPTTFLKEGFSTKFLDIQDRMIRNENSQEYQIAKEASPISHVTSDDPPFLLLHGDQDDIVPFSMSQDLRDSLQKQGIPVRLIRIAGARHGPSFPGATNPPDLDRARVNWLDNWLKEP